MCGFFYFYIVQLRPFSKKKKIELVLISHYENKNKKIKNIVNVKITNQPFLSAAANT